MDYRALASAAEERYGLPAGLLYAQMMAESNGNPNALSKKGALGLMQFMPATARAMKINPLDPMQAIDGAGRMMRRLIDKHGGDLDHALASYNWGEGNVAKLGLDKAPAETRGYLVKVRDAMGQSNVPRVAQGEAATGDAVRFVESLGSARPQDGAAATGEVKGNPYLDFVRGLPDAVRKGSTGAVEGMNAVWAGMKHEAGTFDRGLRGAGLGINPALDEEDAQARADFAAATKGSEWSATAGRGLAFAPLAMAGGLPAWARLGLYATPGVIQSGTPMERAVRGAEDAAMGGAFEIGGKVLGELVARPGPARTNPIARAGVESADEISRLARINAGPNAPQMQLAPYQMAGSGPRSAGALFQDVLDAHPTSAPAGMARQNANTLAVNHAAAFDLGVPLEAGRFTEEVFARAAKRGHELFDRAVPGGVRFDVTPVDAAARNALQRVRMDPQADMAHVAQFEEQLFKHPAFGQDALVRGRNGTEMKDLHKWLTDYRSKAWRKGLSAQAEAADEVINALEDALSTQLKALNAAANSRGGSLLNKTYATDVEGNFAAARKHWAALSTLERPNVVKHGDVMPGNLHQTLMQRYGRAIPEGRLEGGIPEISRWYDKMGHSAANSGTEGRTFARQLMTNPVGALTGSSMGGSATGAALGAMAGDPVMGAVAGGVAGFGLPWAVQRTMNSGPMRALYNRPGLPAPISRPTYELLRSTGLLTGFGLSPDPAQ